MEKSESTGSWIEGFIKQFCLDSTDNFLENDFDKKAWDEPPNGT